MTRLFTIVALACTMAACGGGDAPADAATDSAPVAAVHPDVAKALDVARGLVAHPTKTDSILQANGLTAATLDSLLYRIAADSALSAQYEAGR